MREIDNDTISLQRGWQVARDRNSQLARASHCAGVFADSRAAGLVDGCDQFQIGRLLNRSHDGATHPAADAADDDTEPHLVLQQTEIAHRHGEFFEVSFGHGRERQPQLGSALSHQGERGFYRDGIGFDE